MSFSTLTRSFGVPANGQPGVDSSMYRPYSGWKVGIVELRCQLITGKSSIRYQRGYCVYCIAAAILARGYLQLSSPLPRAW